MVVCRAGASTFTAQGYVGRIAVEALHVLVDPLEGEALVLEASVARNL